MAQTVIAAGTYTVVGFQTPPTGMVRIIAAASAPVDLVALPPASMAQFPGGQFVFFAQSLNQAAHEFQVPINTPEWKLVIGNAGQQEARVTYSVFTVG